MTHSLLGCWQNSPLRSIPYSQCSLYTPIPATLGRSTERRGTVMGHLHPRETKTNQMNCLNHCLFNSFHDFTVGNRFCAKNHDTNTHTQRLTCMCTHTQLKYISSNNADSVILIFPILFCSFLFLTYDGDNSLN